LLFASLEHLLGETQGILGLAQKDRKDACLVSGW
jgi:hypothetical protein